MKKFCGYSIFWSSKKKCNFTGTVFDSWPQIRKLASEIYVINRTNLSSFLWLMARILHRKSIFDWIFHSFLQNKEHFFLQNFFKYKLAKTDFCTQTSEFSAFTLTNLHLSLKLEELSQEKIPQLLRNKTLSIVHLQWNPYLNKFGLKAVINWFQSTIQH